MKLKLALCCCGGIGRHKGLWLNSERIIYMILKTYPRILMEESLGRPLEPDEDVAKIHQGYLVSKSI
jgi:hypothetical protein